LTKRFFKTEVMNLQYISDAMGHTTAVQIPIEDWELIKKKYKGLEEEENLPSAIPEWQMVQVKKEKEQISEGTATLLDWEEVKKQFKIPD
jgi:hypothetical protein